MGQSLRRKTATGLYCVTWAVGIALFLSTAAMAASEPKSGGILRFAVESEPSNYDCQANVSFSFLESVAPNYSTLLKFDTTNYPQVIGDLAESWSISPDKLTYNFRLRSNVLFHDGAPLTSSDVKASYQRILHPPPGVISARQSDYASIVAIDVPDPLTIIFHLQRPDAAMPARFASPWNCIYQGARLDADPQFPRTHVLGTGPFVFVEHKTGEHWIGRRWDHYFQPGKPYLDGYEADFMSGSSVVKSMQAGEVMGGFRSFAPAERDELEATLGDRINVQESPWLFNLMLVFNSKQPPFNDPRVRRALSLAIDRWGMANTLSHTTVLKFVGGLMRPGFEMATPEAALATLPGFSHDIAASREEARRLLAEAGLHDLKITLVSRDLPSAYGPSAEAVLDAWRAIGVTANEVRLNAKDWHMALESGHFTVAFDYEGDAFDDPTLQLAKYVSHSVSPSSYAHSFDQTLDDLYVGQATSTDPRKRADIVRDFERRALTEAYSVPILWWNRIVITPASLRGWNMTPSAYIGQDLADVWIDSQIPGTGAPPPGTATTGATTHIVFPTSSPAPEGVTAPTKAAAPTGVPAPTAPLRSPLAPTEATAPDASGAAPPRPAAAPVMHPPAVGATAGDAHAEAQPKRQVASGTR
jgi:peptide/nickel transport system substrate-binding protein